MPWSLDCGTQTYWVGDERVALLPETKSIKTTAALADAAAHVASLSVASEAGPFWVTLSAGIINVDPAESLANAIELADHRLHAAKRAGRNRVLSSDHASVPPRAKFLPVEDDSAVAPFVTRLLDRESMLVHWVESGERELAAMGDARYDATLLDVDLPGMDGLQVLRELERTQGRNGWPVLVLTAAPRKDVLKERFRLGAAEYVGKIHMDVELIVRLQRLWV